MENDGCISYENFVYSFMMKDEDLKIDDIWRMSQLIREEREDEIRGEEALKERLKETLSLVSNKAKQG